MAPAPWAAPFTYIPAAARAAGSVWHSMPPPAAFARGISSLGCTPPGPLPALDLQLGRWRAAGFSIAAPASGEAAEEDGYRATTANLRLRYRRGPGLQGELGLRRQRNRQDIEGFDALSFQLIDDPDYIQRDASWQGYAELRAVPYPGWRQRLRAGLFRLRRIAENGPLAGGACCSSDRRGFRGEFLWDHDVRMPFGRLHLGLDVNEERIEDRQTASRRDLGHRSVWLRSFLWSERLRVGLRHAEHDVHGGHTTWGAPPVRAAEGALAPACRGGVGLAPPRYR